MLVLWCQSIVNRNHDTRCAICQGPTGVVSDINIPEYPPTTVKVHEDRERAPPFWRIDTYGYLTCRAPNFEVLHVGYDFWVTD
jgi:hypothetical protein